jgi:dTDP-4-dehydrorhamnose 3,5-epimerase
MTFTETRLSGAFMVDPEPIEDHRGFFARTWCQREYEAHQLNPRLAQCSVSFNKKKGTLRGMHYQIPPHAEAKLVRCTRGAVYDVIIDLRLDSSTFKQHVAVVLTADNRRMLYVPEGLAHGFQTLEDDTEVFYQISDFYAPDYARGVRWNDPAFGIVWPDDDRIIAERDRNYPDFIG